MWTERRRSHADCMSRPLFMRVAVASRDAVCDANFDMPMLRCNYEQPAAIKTKQVSQPKAKNEREDRLKPTYPKVSGNSIPVSKQMRSKHQIRLSDPD